MSEMPTRPPKWMTYRPYRSGKPDYQFHTTLTYAKNSACAGGTSELYEWSGTGWMFRAKKNYVAGLSNTELNADIKAVQPLFD